MKKTPKKKESNWMTDMPGAIDGFCDARYKALEHMEEKPKKKKAKKK